MGLATSLKEKGLFEAVIARMSPEAAAVLRDPNSERWHSPRTTTEAYRLVVELADAATLTAVTRRSIEIGLGKIILPMVKVTTAMFGMTPNVAMGKYSAGMGQSNRGVTALWKGEDAGGGFLSVMYPCPAPLNAESAIAGSVEFVLSFAKHTARTKKVASKNPNELLLRVDWFPLKS